jgi:hypothetical protein
MEANYCQTIMFSRVLSLGKLCKQVCNDYFQLTSVEMIIKITEIASLGTKGMIYAVVGNLALQIFL